MLGLSKQETLTDLLSKFQYVFFEMIVLGFLFELVCIEISFS